VRRKFSILYVDDEESNLRIFKDTFRRNYIIFTAISGKEGIEILDNNTIDLVLSDQRMPEMTGVEFLRYTMDKYPEPNRILITGYSDISAIENAINHAHIFQYVQKPWNEKKLSSVIKSALSIYDLEQENKKQKTELIEAKRKAEESDRLKTEFIQNMSHEIRTPLNSILGFSGLIKESELPAKEQGRYIDIILNSGNQLVRVIDDILEISFLETKQVKVIDKKICLNDLFSEISIVFNSKANENEIPLYLKKELSDKESFLVTDVSKLRKILCNLIENALKFTKEGFVEFGYRIRTDCKPVSLEMYVKDTGPGISPEKQEIIFSRFSQGARDLSNSYGGLGLGLSIAKENAILLGGGITLESEEGKGATFFVTIPYEPVN
jgi:signal transduction histidine kinase